MAYTYRLSRRLAQIHIVAFLALGACADQQSLEPSSESVDVTTASSVEFSAPIQLSSVGVFVANEPSNFIKLTDRPFNKKVEAGWKDRGDPAFSISSDAAAPVSPSQIGRANFKKGFLGGNAPINTWYSLPGQKRNVYVSFWVKLSSNWVGHKSGVNKILFFQINRGNKVYLTAQGVGNSILQPQVRVQQINEVPVTRNLLPNLNLNQNIIRGRWQHWEVVLRANTNGQPNGQAEWWIDGVRVGFHNNINFVPASAPNYWEEVKWNPTWGGTGGVVPASQDMWIDDAYVSGI